MNVRFWNKIYKCTYLYVCSTTIHVCLALTNIYIWVYTLENSDLKKNITCQVNFFT